MTDELDAKFDASVKAIGDGIDRLRAENAEPVRTGEALLAAAERHIFSDECLQERDAFRAALAKVQA